MSTRRQFLFDCSALLAAVCAAPAGAVAESTAPFWNQQSCHEIPFSALAAQLNTPFRIQAPSGRMIKVTLAEVKIRQDKPLKSGRRPPQDAGNEKFSMVFSGSRAELLEQNTYPFEHQRLGQFDLFVVPIFTRNPAKIDYQAVVNRPRKRAVQTHT